GERGLVQRTLTAGPVMPGRVTAIARLARPGSSAYNAPPPPPRRSATRSALLGSAPATSANLPGRLPDPCNSAAGRNRRCSVRPPQGLAVPCPPERSARPLAPPAPPAPPAADS